MRTMWTRPGRAATIFALVASTTVGWGVVNVDYPAFAATKATGQARTEIEGTLTRIANEGLRVGEPSAHGSDETVVLRTAENDVVDLTGVGVEGFETGMHLRAVVTVPAEVVAAARSSHEVRTKDGGHVDVNGTDLADASDGTPSRVGSPVSAASTASSVATGHALDVSQVRVLSAAAAPVARKVHDITVAVVAPKGVNGAVANTASIRAQVAGASSYWSDQTGGAISFRLVSVSTPYYSQYTCSDPSGMWAEAKQRTGFVDGAGKHLVVSFPRNATSFGCSYGLGSIGSSTASGGDILVSDTTWPVLAHEFGHNFGLGHSKGLVCARSDVRFSVLPGGCYLNEYGYSWSVMAASAPDRAGNVSSAQATLSGIMPARDLVTVASGSRVVSLRPYGSGRGTGLRAVRVVDPISREQYFVEYRTHVGRDAKLYTNSKDGVRIVNVDDSDQASEAEVVLDPTPTGRADGDRRLLPGRTFRSYTGGITVTTKSVGATATVVVTASAGAKRFTSATVSPGSAAVAAPSVDAVAGPSSSATIRWSGAMPGSAYDVRYRSVGTDARGKVAYGAARPWLSGTTRTSATLRAVQGSVYQVSVRARNATATGAWSAWTSVTFATDAQSRGAGLTGRWAAGHNSAYYAGTYLTTSVKGAALTRPATWTNRVDIVGPRHARGAVAQVYVDGKLKAKVDTYAPRATNRQLLARVALPWGRHAVRVVNASTSAARPALVVDAVAYSR